MLTELIDQRQRLLAEIDEREQALKVLDHDIMFNLLESGEKQAFGTDKTGVALTSTTRYEYSQPVYRYLDSKGLLPNFAVEPKVTKGKLDALLKEGVLSYADMAEIEKHTIVEQSPYALRRVVPKEARIIP